MESILGDIKSIPGVTGTMVLAKDSLESYHLLPHSFTSGAVKSVGERLLRLAHKLPPHSRLNLKFENGVGLVYNLERSVVLIFGRSDLDFSLLGLVLKSALRSIERRLESLSEEPQPVDKAASGMMDQEGLNVLVQAINLVAQSYVQDRGVFWVTKNLRRTKEDVVKEFPLVSGFYVDNHGRVSVLGASREMFDRRVSLALAKWIDLFVEHTPHPPPRDRLTDIRKLTARISAPLEGIGFYDVYSRVTRKLV
jgi:hypothetical protein